MCLRANGRAAKANFDESGNFVPRVSTESSEYRGVSWSKSHNQWWARIHVAGKPENLSYFDDEVEAARAFDKTRGRARPPDELQTEIDYSA